MLRRTALFLVCYLAGASISTFAEELRATELQRNCSLLGDPPDELTREVGKKSAKRVRRAWAASRGGGNKQPSSLVALDKTCRLCHRPLIEIEHYGERLIGCMYCNRWAWEGSQDLFMALPEQDLQALGNLSNARHKAEDTTP
jgi:hypothetical protein